MVVNEAKLYVNKAKSIVKRSPLTIIKNKHSHDVFERNVESIETRTGGGIVVSKPHNSLVENYLNTEKDFGIEVKQSHYDTWNKVVEKAKNNLEEDGLLGLTEYDTSDSADVLFFMNEAIDELMPLGRKMTCISEALEAKKSDCDIRTYMILALNEELNLNLPLYAVEAPSHMFIRYDASLPGEEKQYGVNYFNWETTGNHDDNRIDDSFYIDCYGIKEEQIQKGIYLKNLPKERLSYQGHAVVGWRYSEMGDYENAVRAFSSIPIEYSNYAVYGSLGESYRKLGQYDKAITNYNRSIEINPYSPQTFIERGMTYLKSNQFSGAVEDYTKAGDIYIDQKNYKSALASYSKAIDISLQNSAAFMLEGNNLFMSGNFKEAVEKCFKATDISSGYKSILHKRASTFYSLGRYEESLIDITQYIEMNPNAAHAYYNRGMIYEELGQIDRAINDYEKVCELKLSGSLHNKALKRIQNLR